MNEVLTQAEIEVRYPNEWIVIFDPETGPGSQVRGVVAVHGKDRDEVERQAMAFLRPQRVAFFFTGPESPQE